MSISVTGAYSEALYKWQGQKLVSSGASGSTSKASQAASSIFGGTSMSNQVSSMVELTKYAMEQMGVSSSGRVTFSQISKYRESLQSEFSQGVKAGFAASGVSNPAGLTFTIDKYGAISAAGANAADRKLAQSWLDANPSYGKEILANLQKNGAETGNVTFTISSTGKMTAINNSSKTAQAALDAKTDIFDYTRENLEKLGCKIPAELAFNDDGDLVVTNGGENAEKINAWLKENPETANEIKAAIKKAGAHESAATLRLGEKGAPQISLNDAEVNKIQAALDDSGKIGAAIYNSLANQGIDANANFSIQVNDDGTFEIISDSPDKEKIQRFFEENPELLKKYRQIEALAGIDDARKAMRLSPAETRKRVQIESLSSWWWSSGDSSSFFGQYSNGNLSLMSGLNLKV